MSKLIVLAVLTTAFVVLAVVDTVNKIKNKKSE